MRRQKIVGFEQDQIIQKRIEQAEAERGLDIGPAQAFQFTELPLHQQDGEKDKKGDQHRVKEQLDRRQVAQRELEGAGDGRPAEHGRETVNHRQALVLHGPSATGS